MKDHIIESQGLEAITLPPYMALECQPDVLHPVLQSEHWLFHTSLDQYSTTSLLLQGHLGVAPVVPVGFPILILSLLVNFVNNTAACL